MNRGRRLFFWAQVVGLSTGWALLMAACGESSSPPRAASADSTPRLAIAAASDLRYALDDLVAAFREQQPAAEIDVSYGASGSFYAQLLNGAPFDLYLSADIDYAHRLAAEGAAEPDSLFTYAEGRLVVWVAGASPVDVESLGLRALTDASIARVSIANPELAPYGRAAEAALRSAGLYDAIESKLVLGENVSQALQFVESGAAQAGVVALSLALAPPVAGAGRYALVPADLHPPLEQGGVVIGGASGAEAAWTFRAFMLGPDGQAVLDRYGFRAPR